MPFDPSILGLGIVAIVGYLVFIVWTDYRRDKSPGPWRLRAVCPCGWHTESKADSLCAVPVHVCPKCGTSKWEFEMQVMRWSGKEWESKESQ